MNESLSFDIIGRVNSPYKEKFAIPRQPGLVSAASGNIELLEGFNDQNTVKALTQFSHIWVIFVFHQTLQQGWKPLIRPPRLGGNEKIGVFASRSTFRPNPIGMSVVKLDDIKISSNCTKLIISGLDLLDQTPVLDIKPYIPYADAKTEANAGFANTKPETNKQVIFSDNAQNEIASTYKEYNNLPLFIEQVLAQDPRPAYKQQKIDNKIYGMQLYDLNIMWQMSTLSEITVLSINKVTK